MLQAAEQQQSGRDCSSESINEGGVGCVLQVSKSPLKHPWSDAEVQLCSGTHEELR